MLTPVSLRHLSTEDGEVTSVFGRMEGFLEEVAFEP